MSVEAYIEVKVIQETWLVEIRTPDAWDEKVIFRINHLLEVTPLTSMAKEKIKDPIFMDMITNRLKNHMSRDGTAFTIIA
jgi:hypothetical protein